jgi:alcohol dehydrogenase class IV
MIELHLPSQVIIGGGAAAGLSDHVSGLGISRPLVVTDRYLLEQGPAGPLAERLGAAGVFADVQPDPTLDNVHGALEAMRNHDADGVVGIGGGSPLDTAKAASVLAANDGDLRDWAGYHKIPGPGLPLVAVPTTAGTGSEVTRVAAITDAERDVKMMILSNHLLPRTAVVDYELSLTAPAALSAHVGVDSLTHAIEAYVSTRANVVTDLFALKAAKLIGDHLRRVVADGGDREAREAMMLGATLAGAAFSNASVALVHGMSRPIGAHFHLAHGLSNAVLLPTVTRFSVSGAPERYGRIANEMGLDGGADGLVEELEALNRDLGVPTIGGAGVQRDRFESVVEEMAQAALDSGSPGFNPRPATREEIVELYRQAF